MVTSGNPGFTKVLGTQRNKIPEADMGWITEYPAIDHSEMILQAISVCKRDSLIAANEEHLNSLQYIPR